MILSQAANGPVLSVPVRSYEAVLLAANAAGDGKAGIVLFHQNEDLSVPLCIANDFDTLREDWQLWGETLDKPLARATDVRVPANQASRLGALQVYRPRARRANSFFAARRPAFLTRRQIGNPECIRILPREVEIIARD